MSSFKKKNYTRPVIYKHNNDVSKDWYVFFCFKDEGKIRKYKRREGVNRIKELNERLNAINELVEEIEFDLQHGWNPILDPKRELNYNPVFNKTITTSKQKVKTKKPTKNELYWFLFNK